MLYIMRMNLILEILDIPGQLVSILNPIGELGANVVTIVIDGTDKTGWKLVV